MIKLKDLLKIKKEKDGTKFYLSKVVLTNAALIALAKHPTVRQFVIENPDLALEAIGLINIGLRSLTKGKLKIK